MKNIPMLAALAAALTANAQFTVRPWTQDNAPLADRVAADFKDVKHPATFVHYGASSPLLNAGAKLPWMSGARDLAGGARLIGKPDIGCYESPLTPHTIFIVQ